jgi:multiple sugar transport system permease protein
MEGHQMSIVKKTLFYLFIFTIMMTVLIPVSYLTTISFSSTIETYDYPKQMLPSLSHELRVTWDEETSFYTIQRKSNTNTYEDLYISARFDRISTYLESYLNVIKTEDELEEDFVVAKDTGESIDLRYYKSFFRNYTKFFDVFTGAEDALMNSIQAAVITILMSMTIGGTVGYALARTKIKGKETIGVLSLIVRMFPVVSISVPMAILLIQYGMFDTMLGLAIIYSIPNIGLTAWITRSIFLGINKELEEASYVFGATKFQTFKKITFPLVLPAFAASSMYAFITAWNDTAVSLLLTDRNQTLALLIYKSIGGSASINYSAAGAVILILPALVFTFLLKNYINKMWG